MASAAQMSTFIKPQDTKKHSEECAQYIILPENLFYMKSLWDGKKKKV